MKKRALSLLLVLAICLTLLPAAALAQTPDADAPGAYSDHSVSTDTADTPEQPAPAAFSSNAANDDEPHPHTTGGQTETFQTVTNEADLHAVNEDTQPAHEHCLCLHDRTGGGYLDDNHTVHSNTLFSPWDPYEHLDTNGKPTLPTGEGSYYLTCSIRAEDCLNGAEWENSVKIDLCLNGYDIYTSLPLSVSGSGTTLNITNCKDTGAIKPAGTSSANTQLELSFAKLHLYSGTLNIPVVLQGGNTDFHMHGGQIANTGRTGVLVGSGNRFFLYGGEITGNTADAKLTSPTRLYGGGVLVKPSAAFYMSGGTIRNNTAAGYGGGVMLAGSDTTSGGRFVMTSGTITGNSVNRNTGHDPYGGGVYVSQNATFRLKGDATITGNTRPDDEANNVRLGNAASVVTLTGPLTGGAESIGISKASGEQQIAVPAAGYQITETDKAAFTSDDTRKVTLKDDGSLWLINCPHTDVDEATATCNTCGLPISVKVENPATADTAAATLYIATKIEYGGSDASLRDALAAAADGSTLTLLRDDVSAYGVFDGKTITLDLNGKRLMPGNGIYVNGHTSDTPATLKLIGQNADYDTYDTSQVIARIFQNANLDLSGWTGTTLDGVTLQGGTMTQLPNADCTLRYLYLEGSSHQLTRGRFDAISTRYETTLGSLLQTGYAFRRFGESTEYVPYDTQIAAYSLFSSVEVVACPHEKIEHSTCVYCNKGGLIAKLSVNGTDTFYNDGGAAFVAMRENGGTLTMYGNITVFTNILGSVTYLHNKTAVLDLNGYTYEMGSTAGGEFNERSLSLWANGALTVRDSSPGHTGRLSRVSFSGDNARLTVEEGAYVQYLRLNDKCSVSLDLKEGAKLGSLYTVSHSGLMPAELLQPGDYLSGSPDLTASPVTLTTGEPMVVGKVPGTVAAAAGKTGELPYHGTIPAALLPTVTLNASAGSPQLCYDWYRKVTASDSALIAQHFASVSPNGVCTMEQTAFDGVQVGDTLNVFCIITAKDASGATLWQTPVCGYTLTVVKGTPTITGAPTAVSGLIYNTDPQTLIQPDGTSNADGLLYSLRKDGSYSAALPTGTDAGTYEVWYKAKGNNDYNDGDPADAPITVTIQPKTVTATVTVNDTPTYTGQPLTPAVAVTDGAHTIPASEYTLEYTNNTNAGTNTAAVTVNNKNGGNYIVRGSANFSIAQAAAPTASQTGKMTIVNGLPGRDYTLDLTALLPAAPSGDYGTITYRSARFTPAADLAADESYTLQTLADANGLLTLTVNATTGNHVGQIGMIAAEVETTNYQRIALEIAVYADPKPRSSYSDQVKAQIEAFEAKKRGEGSEPFAFDDVNEDDYFFEAVQWAVENGITNGVSKTRFGAALGCTRGQTVTFLHRAEGKPETGAQPLPLHDVAADSFCYPAVQWAMQTGIAAGKGAGRFAPDDVITRGQFVTFLYRLAGSPAITAAHPFTDVAAGAYYEQAIAWAYAAGITSGTTKTTFSPDAPCTRAQIVTFLYRAFAK